MDARRTDLDPQVAALLAEPTYQSLPPWHALSVEAARRLEDDVFGGEPTISLPEVTDTAIPGADAGSEIPIRVYRPLEAHDLPVLLFYHGGGWTLGTLDSADDLCRAFAAETESLVVSVDYRLAPEHPFPAPLEDAIAALEWVREHAAAIGGDPDRIGVCGSSAGANLAAAVARWDAHRGDDVLAQQVLCYPITDHAFDTPSYVENADSPLLTRADMRWFWNQYLRHPVDGVNPYASVLRASSFDRLPPTTVVTCGHDPLRDEGIAYAEALEDAGVPVSHHHYPSLPHGALSLADEVERSAEAMEKLTDRIRLRFVR
ncbi:alpha/beta hydrolase [Natronosalvus caseinilyticus]|uniref:alpha/beta hydrolase n=1 Tax=Natronosalvus caseinilyticus TaxID=2953747 RepID=UPI0028B0069A|nr:alpha/beta hydrolase [Natronosalvus caseinilyticus]